MSGNDIIFDEASHRYFMDGVEYPSVSTVLQMFCDFSRIPKDVLEFKRKIGRAVHKAIELYESGTLDVDTVDDVVMPYLESWIKFKTVKPFRVIAAEQIVYSKKHRIAGRLDFNVVFDESPDIWQIDAKCVAQMAPETALQTSAYVACWEEMGRDKIKRRGGLQLQPDGSIARLFPYTDKSDLPVFLNALNLFRWISNNRR